MGTSHCGLWPEPRKKTQKVFCVKFHAMFSVFAAARRGTWKNEKKDAMECIKCLCACKMSREANK